MGAAPHWKQGYAVEACKASLQWAKAALFRTRLVSYISPANAASIAVARKLGGVFEKRIVLLTLEAEVYAHTL